MTINVIPFVPDHMLTFVPGSREAEAMLGADIPAMGEFWDGKAMAAVIDGRCVGIFGALEIEGEVTVTALMSDELRSHPLALHRGIKQALIDILDAGYEKISCKARASDARGRKWLHRLGFELDDETDGEVRYILWKQP